MQQAIIVADSRLSQHASAHLLADSEFAVVATAAPGGEALSALSRHVPDLVLVDLVGCVGLVQVLDTVRRTNPEAHAIVLADEDDTSHVVAAFQHGARGMLARQRPSGELLEAVRKVADGQAVVDPSLAAPLVLHITRRVAVTGPFGLSRREEAVVAHLPRQLTNGQIGSRMGISTSTVRTHLRHAFRKLNVNDRVEAALLAVEHGLA